MSLFDSLKGALGNVVSNTVSSATRNAVSSAQRSASRAANQAVNNLGNSISHAVNTQTKSFTFQAVPKTLEELQALPEASMKDYFGVAALSMLVLLGYKDNKEESLKMYDFLMGPGAMSNLDISRIDEHMLRGRDYIARSYFEGATVDNNYTPSMPLTIKIIEGAHSKDCIAEGRINLFVHSSGADSDRYMTFRTKPSTGEWFLTELAGVLPDIRVPKAEDPWA